MTSPSKTVKTPRSAFDLTSLFKGDLQVHQRVDLSNCKQITVDVEYKTAAALQRGSQYPVTFTVVAVSWLHWRIQYKEITMTQGETETVAFDFGPLPEGIEPEGRASHIKNQYFVSADRFRDVSERNEDNNGLLMFGTCFV